MGIEWPYLDLRGITYLTCCCNRKTQPTSSHSPPRTGLTLKWLPIAKRDVAQQIRVVLLQRIVPQLQPEEIQVILTPLPALRRVEFIKRYADFAKSAKWRAIFRLYHILPMLPFVFNHCQPPMHCKRESMGGSGRALRQESFQPENTGVLSFCASTHL